MSVKKKKRKWKHKTTWDVSLDVCYLILKINPEDKTITVTETRDAHIIKS